ncbi:MAG: fibronectin type III domain-containing protein [Leptospiraceae bacterium]|nr:fibronectin type III domain-containing protein [Leptospiraceae bacterium]
MNFYSNSLLIAKYIKYFYSRVNAFFYLSIIIFILSSSIHAETKKAFTYYIEWLNVPGAKGYLIQFKDKSTGVEKEEKLTQNNIELKLPTGYYEYRIASVNKFGKPSIWTQWEEFYVEKDKPKPGKKNAKQLEVKEAEVSKTEIKKWKWFVPGLTQYQSNQKLYASLWILWFTGLAVYGNSERLAGNNLANDPLNDPKNLSVIALGSPVLLDLYLWDKRSQAKSQYDEHQSNQAAVGVVAILSYALQVWHAKKVSDMGNVSIELNSRSNRYVYAQGIQADNPILSFELKISARY